MKLVLACAALGTMLGCGALPLFQHLVELDAEAHGVTPPVGMSPWVGVASSAFSAFASAWLTDHLHKRRERRANDKGTTRKT